MRILIAEDDQTSRLYLQKILSSFGDCDTTVDGMETMEAYLLALQEEQPYDLLCLDIMMPKANGIKVLNAIRDLEKKKKIKKDKRVKVIVISALAQVQLINDSITPGYDIYLPKPVETAKLTQAMRELGIL